MDFSIALKIFNRTTEPIYAVWNTTAGGGSAASTPGNNASYYSIGEGPDCAFDGNLTSSYTSFGQCYSGSSSIFCGINTGLYLTLNAGSFTLVAFYIVTRYNYPQRDPLTMTIEGSNANETLLTHGSSWVQLYSGSTGLDQDPGRSAYGALQILINQLGAFRSYRFLVTSKRNISSATAYSEIVMVGY